MAEAQALGLGVTALNDPLDVLADPHFRARGFWAAGRAPRRRPLRDAGAARSAWSTVGDCAAPPPLLDQHGDEVRAELAAAGRARRRRAAPAADRPTAPDGRARCAAAGRHPGARPDRGVGGALRHHAARRPRRRGHPGRQPQPVPHRHPGRHPPAQARPSRRPGRHLGRVPRRRPRAAALEPGRDRSWSTPARSWGPRSICAPSWAGRRSCAWSSAVRRAGGEQLGQGPRPAWASAGTCWPPATPVWSCCACRRSACPAPTPATSGFGAHVEALCGLTSLRGYPDRDLSANGAHLPHGPGQRRGRRLRRAGRAAPAGAHRSRAS